MKKTIFVFCIFICLFDSLKICVASSVSEITNTLIDLDVIDEKYFSQSDSVTREEALIVIMRIIGITDEDIRNLNGADYIAFADTEHYSYFGCAHAAEIAYGEECVVVYPTLRTRYTLKNTDYFFFPKRKITLKECLALMVRCLQSECFDFE